MNLIKKLFGKKAVKQPRNIRVAFVNDVSEEIEIKYREKPSQLIEIMQDRKVVHDLMIRANQKLRYHNQYSKEGIEMVGDGYAEDEFRVYETEEGIFHDMTFVNQESVSRFSKGLEALGYKLNPDNSLDINGTKIQIRLHKQEIKIAGGSPIRRTAKDICEIYEWSVPKTKPLQFAAPKKLEEITSGEIKIRKAHARWLTDNHYLLTGRDDKDIESDKDTPLVAVHATDYLPKEGKIMPGGPSLDYAGRKTIHFSLNGIATAGFMTSSDETWGGKKYFIIAPLADVLDHNKAFGGIAADFFFPGPVTLPETAEIFTSKEDALKYIDTISRVRSIGNNGWTGNDNPRLCKALNLWEGNHDTHWTTEYESSRSRLKLSHEEALKETRNRSTSLYPEEKIEPRFEESTSYDGRRISVFQYGRDSKTEVAQRLEKEMMLIGYI